MLFRNLPSLNTLYLVVCILLCLILVTQIKQIYDNNSKYERRLGYKQFISEISNNMIDAEKSVNETSVFMHRLDEILLRQSEQMKKEQRSLPS